MIVTAGPLRHCFLPDCNATESLAHALAPLLRPGDVVLLKGDLGSGKTSFARALIRALPEPSGEIKADEEVPSPTFTLVQIYERQPAEVWHFDLYRLSSAEEVHELAWEEALGTAIILVEWPERLGPLTPANALTLHLDWREQGRLARFEGDRDWAARLAALPQSV